MNQKNNSGFTLLFAVLVAGSLLAAVMTITSITFKQLILSSVGRESQVAFFAADMGAECAIYLDNKLDYFYTYEASPLPNEIKCGGGFATGVERVMDETTEGCSGSTCFESEFIFSTDPDDPKAPNAKVTITKNITTRQTRIESLGYNTGDESNLRRVERAIRLTYYQVPRQVCNVSGDTMILIDSSSLPANAKPHISNLVGNMFGSLAVNKVGLIKYDNIGVEMLAHLTVEEDVGVLQDIINNDLTLSFNGAPGDLSGALDLAEAELSGLTLEGDPEEPSDNRLDSEFPNYIIIITGGSNDPSYSSITAATSEADDVKSNTGASIYTIAYGVPTTSGSESLDKRIAGNPANQSSSSGANDPYNEKYSYVAKTLEDLEMVVASITGCH